MGGVYPLAAVTAAETSSAPSGRPTHWRSSKEVRVGLSFSCRMLGMIAAPTLVWLLAIMGVSAAIMGFSAAASWRISFLVGGTPAAVAICEVLCFHGLVDSPSTDSDDLEKHQDGEVAVTADELSRNEIFRRLLGTAGTWMIFDIVVYGISTALPDITKQLLESDNTAQAALSTMAVSTVMLPAAGLSLYLCQDSLLGRKRLQELGFVVMATGLLLLAVAYHSHGSRTIMLVVYCVMMFSTSFSCATTTFMLPQEVFPKRIRSSMNGISAAAGKFGAVIGAALFAPVDVYEGLTVTLVGCALLSLVGALMTFMLVVDMRPQSEVACNVKGLPKAMS